jgi:hypothetical protein
MVRGISIAGTSLPVTDASISFTKDPIREQSMSGLGGEALYKGLYGPAQGSFSAAYRPAAFKTYIQQLYTVTPSSYTIVVSDDHENAFTSTTSYITSAEISLKAGELAKVNMGFVGMQVSAAGSVATPSDTLFGYEIPVFYNSSISSGWGVCSGFSVKIDRPYTADDYRLGGDNFYSQSIYQSGETTVSGTITLSQIGNYNSLADATDLTFTLGTAGSITISDAVLSGAELGINGRGLISKTFNWAAPSDGVIIA